MRSPIVSSERLLKAAAEYHADGGGRADHGEQQYSYTEKVLKPKRDFFTSPERLEDLLSVLREWKATRFKDATTIVPGVLRRWIPDHLPTLRSLASRRIENLRDEDLVRLGRLASDLSSRGLKPTCYGKTMAFLMPETALIWDDLVVRRLYNFDATPAQYVGYHRMIRELARTLMRDESATIISTIEERHAKVAATREPFAKIVDELAYERAWILFASKEIGAWPLPDGP